jgi:hypothetical protein
LKKCKKWYLEAAQHGLRSLKKKRNKKLKTWRGNKYTQIAHVSLLSILFEKSLVFEKWDEYRKKLLLVARYHIAEKLCPLVILGSTRY